MTRLMVTGSRAKYWRDPRHVQLAIGVRLSTFPPDTVVIVGDADGVDEWTLAQCEITGHECVPFLVDERLPSPARFHERNDRLLADATDVLAVWDGTSPGTKSVIDKAKRKGLQLWVVNPEGPTPWMDAARVKELYAQLPTI